LKDGVFMPAKSNVVTIKAKISQGPSVPLWNPHSSMWHYIDPQGHVQGPFPLISLQGWHDSRYFSPDFKVWQAGQSQDQSVLLVDILSKFFPVRCQYSRDVNYQSML